VGTNICKRASHDARLLFYDNCIFTPHLLFMKNYKLLLFFLGSCILWNTARAQHKYTFSFEKPELVHLPGHSRKLTVIDARQDKNIGSVKTGAFNRNAVLITETPFKTMLEALYDSMKNNQPADDELVLVLYNWMVADNPNSGEIGSMYFEGDFYRGKDEQYAYVGTADSVFEVAAGLDITKKLIAMVQIETSRLLQYYGSAKVNSEFIYTKTNMQDRRRKERMQYPIYTTTDFKKGVYYTVDQFINNTPVDTPFKRETLIINNGERKDYQVFYLNAKGKKGKYIKPDTYFAIYDGTIWSLADGKNNRIMKYENGEFLTYKLLLGQVNKQANAAVAGALVGGAVGAVVAGGIAGSGRNLAKVMYQVKFDPAIKDFVRIKRL
jgi:hypothetical protein